MKAKCYFCGGETDAIIFKEERRKHVWKDWLIDYLSLDCDYLHDSFPLHKLMPEMARKNA